MKIYLAPCVMKIPLINSQLKAKAFTLLLLVAVGCLTGCLSRPALKQQAFAFNIPEETTGNTVNGNRVLGIRSLSIAAPFDGRSFVYRTGEFSYVRDPYAEFLETPAEELISPMRKWLSQSGGFSSVVEPGSALKPDLLVEITISQFYGDFRQPEQPAAVIVMQCVYFNATNGVPVKIIFEQEYSRQVPLSAPSAAALMAGWNQALSEILSEVSSDLRPPNKRNQGEQLPFSFGSFLQF